MHKMQFEKNKGFGTINLLSIGEIHRQMWLYILRFLVLLPMSCFSLLFYIPFFVPTAVVSRADLESMPLLLASLRYFKNCMLPFEHNPHLFWTPGIFELLKSSKGNQELKSSYLRIAI